MLKFSSNANSILSSFPCSQPGIQLNDLWWAWSTLPSVPSANGFQRDSARVLPRGNKSRDNENLPSSWLGINRKGSRAELHSWEQGGTGVRVNAGCKGCVKPSSSLRRKEKKREENYLLRPCMKEEPLETVARNSNTCPTKSNQQSTFLQRLCSWRTNCSGQLQI